MGSVSPVLGQSSHGAVQSPEHPGLWDLGCLLRYGPHGPSISPITGPPALTPSHPVTTLPSSPERVFGFMPAAVCVTSPACLIHGAEAKLAAGAPLLPQPLGLQSPSVPKWVPLATPALLPSQPDRGGAAGPGQSAEG